MTPTSIRRLKVPLSCKTPPPRRSIPIKREQISVLRWLFPYHPHLWDHRLHHSGSLRGRLLSRTCSKNRCRKFVWRFTFGWRVWPYLRSVWTGDRYVFQFVTRKLVLTLRWRLWWSNLLSIMVATSIHIPCFGNVDWILDTLLRIIVPISSNRNPWTPCWAQECDAMDPFLGGLCQDVQEAQESFSVSIWIVSIRHLVAFCTLSSTLTHGHLPHGHSLTHAVVPTTSLLNIVYPLLPVDSRHYNRHLVLLL